MRAVVISKDECPWCVKAKEFLEGFEIEYIEKKLGQDVIWSEEELNQFKTVPQIWVNDNYIGGYESLVEWAINQ